MSYRKDKQNQSLNLQDIKTIKKIITDVASTLNFLSKKLRCENILNNLSPQNFYFMKERAVFLLGKWTKIFEAGSKGKLYFITRLSKISNTQDDLDHYTRSNRIRLIFDEFVLDDPNGWSCQYLKIFNLDNHDRNCTYKVPLQSLTRINSKNFTIFLVLILK